MSDLGIDLPILVAQLINFSILLGLLYLFAYKPILRMLDARSARIKESLEQTEVIKEQAVRAEEEFRAQMDKARKEGQAAIAQATGIGERVKEEARQEARREAEALIVRARAEIERERDESIDQLRREFVDVAMRAAEKVINESLDRTAHRRLIEGVLEESRTLRKG